MSKYFILCGIVIQYFLVANCKQFGYLDLFTCHCKDDNDCNRDGICQNNNGCATGWYGSTCQNQNVALGKPATQGARQHPNLYGPELVVDGDRSQSSQGKCMDTSYSNNRWWSVNLINTYPIRQIRIFYRNDNRNDRPYLYTLRGFKIDVIQDNGASVQCFKQPDNEAPSSDDVTVICTSTIWGSGIIISSPIVVDKYFLVLCEVEVYGLCSNRTYGEECEKFCYCKDNAPCDYVTGKCQTEECLPGYIGSSCNQTCIEGMYGLNCSQDCKDRHCSGSLSCHFYNGKCDNGCFQGYDGIDCTQECTTGTYGKYCAQTCSINCLNVDCNHINGTCIGGCQPGFKSELCDQACREGRYGLNCSQDCQDRHCSRSLSCNFYNGNCEYGCLQGFNGIDCTQECPVGTYGYNCVQTCPINCLTLDCNRINGTCIGGCQPGFISELCDQNCIFGGYYGLNCSQDCNDRHCSGSQSCNFRTGKCDEGCLLGYNGTDCKQECPAGTYGKYCVQTCSINCLNVDCNHINGTCIGGCQPGFISELCDQECSPTMYGMKCSKLCDERNCYGSNECNHITGNCTEGCIPGFSGVDCSKQCPERSYGKNCSKMCTDRNCLQNQNCDRINGTCVDGCKPGYISIDCTQDCEDEFFGSNCSKKCSERNCINNSTVCSNVDGSCNGKCLDGYSDVDCSRYSSSTGTNHNDGNNLILIASTVSGCVFAIIITIIILIVIWRRHVPKKTEISKAGNNKPSIYENVDLKPQQIGKLKQVNETSGAEAVDIDQVQNVAPEANVQINGSIHTANEDTASEEPHRLADHPNQVSSLSPKAKPISPKSAARSPKPTPRPSPKPSPDSTLSLVASKPAIKPKPIKHTAPSIEDNEESLEADHYYSNEDDYYNLPSQTKFTVDELENFISEAKSQNGFKGLFAKLPTELAFPYTTSQLDPNKIKNRFIGYYPYDHSRVVLENTPENPHLDYINANYLDGYSQNRKYIASQGPTTYMIDDFVRMIMEKKCDKVVMVTKDYEMGKMKCLIYWPDDKPITKGDITLTLKKQKIRTNYTIRTILMTKGDSSHTFTQFHYETWPDHDVPDVNDMLDFLYEVNKHQPQSTAPQVVHCSAGVGRTGTFVAVDYCLEQYKDTGSVDIMTCIKRLRNQRRGLVQTFAQLRFIYEALLEGLKRGDTCVYSNMFLNEYKLNTESTALSKQFEHLKSIEVEPDKSNQLYVTDEISLFRFPSHTQVDGYFFQELKGMKSANDIIWKLIYDRQIPSAVFISDNTNETALCPEIGTEENYGETVVESLSENNSNQISTINVMVKSETNETSVPVTVFILDVTDTNNFNQLIQKLLELIIEVDIHHNDYKPMGLFTSDAHYGQTFCLLRNIQQRIRLDSEVEIFRAVKSVHQKLGSTVRSLDGYTMLHKLVYDYLKSTETYANL